MPRDELTVSAVMKMPHDTPVELFIKLLDSAGWRDFHTLAVAEASRYVSPNLSTAIQQPQFRQDWHDALLYSEADLQITAMRQRWEEGPNSDSANSTRINVRRIRRRIDWINKNRPASPAGERPVATVDSWAFNRLREAHYPQYRDLLDRALALGGVHPEVTQHTSMGRAHGLSLGEWATLTGFPMPALDADQLAMTNAAPSFVRVRVAQEVRRYDIATLFDHPCLVDAWVKALTELADAAREALNLSSVHGVEIAEVDLFIDENAEPEQAEHRIALFRFLARLYQRQREASRARARILDELKDWAKRTSLAPRTAARDALIALYPGEHEEHKRTFVPAADRPPPTIDPSKQMTRAPLTYQMTQFIEQTEAQGWSPQVFLHDVDPHHHHPGMNVIEVHRPGEEPKVVIVAAFDRRQGRRRNKVSARAAGITGWILLTSLVAALQMCTLTNAEIVAELKQRQLILDEVKARRTKARRVDM